jgi:hypothetical protein
VGEMFSGVGVRLNESVGSDVGSGRQPDESSRMNGIVALPPPIAAVTATSTDPSSVDPAARVLQSEVPVAPLTAKVTPRTIHCFIWEKSPTPNSLFAGIRAFRRSKEQMSYHVDLPPLKVHFHRAPPLPTDDGLALFDQ